MKPYPFSPGCSSWSFSPWNSVTAFTCWDHSSSRWRWSPWCQPRRLPDTVPTLQPVFRTLWVHVTLSMLGTVGFAVAFVAGVMYLIQDGLLKSKRFNVLYSKLPALDFLDDLNQQSIVLGFPLLTLGIITGAISAEFARGSYVNWNPEQTWALVTWLFYFVVLVGRLTVGWRAKRAAYLTIIGFAGVILTSEIGGRRASKSLRTRCPDYAYRRRRTQP